MNNSCSLLLESEENEFSGKMVNISAGGFAFVSTERALVNAIGKQIKVNIHNFELDKESVLNGIQLPEVPANDALRDKLSNKSLDELTEILKTYKTLHNTTDVDNCKRAIRAIEIQEYYKNNPDEYLKSQKATSDKPNSLIIGIDIPREERRR